MLGELGLWAGRAESTALPYPLPYPAAALEEFIIDIPRDRRRSWPLSCLPQMQQALAAQRDLMPSHMGAGLHAKPDIHRRIYLRYEESQY
jgi:hypothetical protein